MKHLFSLCVLSLALLTPAEAVAQKKSTRKKAKKSLMVPPTQVLPTITATPVDGDTFSEALAISQGAGLKDYLLRQEKVDSAHLADAAKGLSTKRDEKARKEFLAEAAGIKILEMNAALAENYNLYAGGSKESNYFNLDKFNDGLVGVLTNRTSRLTPDSAQKIVEQQVAYQEQVTRVKNVQWLIDNAKVPGVITLPSGLQYKILKEGKGACPSDSSHVEVHYEGKLIDGKVFDSSYKRGEPTSFPVKGVIKGWTEALLKMPEGSVWELYIPQELAYGERGAGRDIPPYSTLIFKVELLKANATKK